MAELERKIREIRRRLILFLFLNLLVRSLLAGLTLAVLYVVTFKLFEIPWHPFAVAGGLIGTSVLIATVWTYFTRVSPYQAALAADESLGLRERLSSAIMLRDFKDPMGAAEALQDDALKFARVIQPRKDFRLKPPRMALHLIWPLGVFIAVYLFMPQLNLLAKNAPEDQQANAQDVKPTDEMRKQEARELKELSKKARQVEDNLKEADETKFAKDLERLSDDLYLGTKDTRAAVAELSRLEDQVKMEKRELDKHNDPFKQIEGLQRAQKTREMQQDLKNQDFEEAAAQMEALANEQLTQMSAQETQQLAQEMQKLSEELKENQDLSQQLQQAAQALNQLAQDKQQQNQQQQQQQQEQADQQQQQQQGQNQQQSQQQQSQQQQGQQQQQSQQSQQGQQSQQAQQQQGEQSQQQAQQGQQSQSQQGSQQAQQQQLSQQGQQAMQQAQQAMQQAAQQMQNQQQLMQEMQQLDQLAQQIAQQRQSMLNGQGEQGSGSQSQGSAGESGESGQSPGGQQGQKQSDQAGNSSGGLCSQCGGSGCNSCGGTGLGQGQGKSGGQGEWKEGYSTAQGLGSGGPGRGRGEVADAGLVPVQFVDDMVRGEKNEGEILAVIEIDAPAEKGESNVRYTQIYNTRAQRAADSMRQNEIPLGYRNVVRDYFEAINPRKRAE